MNGFMEKLAEVLVTVDGFVWGPVMLILLVGTGVFLTIRTGFLTWRNLGYAIKSTLSKEARQKTRGSGDISPFSALTTALAATIGTGNIVGVATAMVSGGPGALVWMWISACFGLTSFFRLENPASFAVRRASRFLIFSLYVRVKPNTCFACAWFPSSLQKKDNTYVLSSLT